MQTATATVAGRRRVSFTLPEPAATTFIPRDVESPSRDDAARRSTWPPTRTERYPEGLRKARAPTRSESEPGPTKTCLLDLAFADESRAVDADAYEELRLGDDFFDYTAWLFFACAITLRCIFHEHVVSLALCWWILPAVIPWWLMLPYHVDPRGSNTAACYRGFLIAEDLYRVWSGPRLTRVVVFLAATVAGQRFCAFVSKRLAISILRDRNAHKRGAMPLKWHV